MAEQCEVLVIGAGLGGLLCGAVLAAAGRKVTVVEQLGYPGGRFGTREMDGFRVPTGAFHMAPYGTHGPLHALLQGLGLGERIAPFPLMGHYWADGRYYSIRRIVDLGSVFRLGDRLNFGRVLFHSKFQRQTTDACSFAAWLAAHGAAPRVREFFHAFCQFALGVTVDGISYNAARPIMSHIVHGRHPGLVRGGCGALVGELQRRIEDGGGQIRLRTTARALLLDGARVRGAVVQDRHSGREERIACDTVVYNGGPWELGALLPAGTPSPLALPPGGRTPAYGIALHFRCREAMTAQEGIVFCLGTRRVAGFVQQTLTDPSLAPAGEHLLSTCWVPQSADMRAEAALAYADLRDIFGPRFDHCCARLTQGLYQGKWPVNHAVQGMEVSPASALAGLHVVGDAYKPAGYPMAEGVAGSVRRCLREMGVDAPARA